MSLKSICKLSQYFVNVTYRKILIIYCKICTPYGKIRHPIVLQKDM